MDTTMTNDTSREEPNVLQPQQRLGRPDVHQTNRKTPDKGIDRRLNLHSVHILALEAMIASMPQQNGIDAERVYAYIDARATDGNSNLGTAAKKVAAELLEAAGSAEQGSVKLGEIRQPKMMKRAASWLIAVVAATAIVTAGFVGVAALVLKTGFSG